MAGNEFIVFRNMFLFLYQNLPKTCHMGYQSSCYDILGQSAQLNMQISDKSLIKVFFIDLGDSHILTESLVYLSRCLFILANVICPTLILLEADCQFVPAASTFVLLLVCTCCLSVFRCLHAFSMRPSVGPLIRLSVYFLLASVPNAILFALFSSCSSCCVLVLPKVCPIACVSVALEDTIFVSAAW